MSALIALVLGVDAGDADAAKDRRGRAAFACAAVLTAAAFVLCAALLRWPGTRTFPLRRNEQATFTANGLFIHTVDVGVSPGGTRATVRGYAAWPADEYVVSDVMSSTFVPTQGVRTNGIGAYVGRGEGVGFDAAALRECNTTRMEFKLCPQDAYVAFAKNNDATGCANTYVGPGGVSGFMEVHSSDVYYCVYYNPNCAAARTATTLSCYTGSHDRRAVGSPAITCYGRCTDTVPFGQIRYYAADVPIDPSGLDRTVYTVTVVFHGYAGAYIALYVGLFIPLAFVTALVLYKRALNRNKSSEETLSLLSTEATDATDATDEKNATDKKDATDAMDATDERNATDEMDDEDEKDAEKRDRS